MTVPDWWLVPEAIASTSLDRDPDCGTRDVGPVTVGGNCPRNPSGGDHEDQERTDPMTGLPVKVCKHCGRQA